MKIRRLVNLCVNEIKLHGVSGLIKAALLFVWRKTGGVVWYKMRGKRYKKEAKTIFQKKCDRIVIWNSSFGWNVTLFQRPQHIARALAKQGTLVFYEVTPYTDPDVESYKEIEEGLWLINRLNKAAYKILQERLKCKELPKYMQIYSTELELSVDDLKQYQEEGYTILYEYIDDINPEISVTEQIPENIQKKYEYVMENPDIPVVVTADRLKEDVERKRGGSNLAFSTNGVDYYHFADSGKMAGVTISKEYEEIVNSGRTIIGYYGALATWFDYELLKYIVTQRNDIVFVLIGKVYDEFFHKQGLEQYENIKYIGEVPYQFLPAYARCFDICTIPFVVNDLTNATSPLKLFEYMALSKPIITTGMQECRKYESVLIAENYDDYINKVDYALHLIETKDSEYYGVLKKEALENTWDSKAQSIVDMLKKHESK